MSNQNLLIKEQLNEIKPRFIEIADEQTFKKEVSFAVQHLSKNAYLAGATKNSILQAVLNIAQTGLTLNPVLKLAYLVPRKEGNAVVCYLEPSYQGVVKLVTDTGSAKSIHAHVVHDGDEFDVIMGTETRIIHKPKFMTDDVSHVYAVATLHDGSKQIEVMTVDQINDIRATSESYKAFERKQKEGKTISCPWVDYYEEMARKTVLKRLVKYLPKTDMWDKLATAIEIDNAQYGATSSQLDFIDSLLITAAITPEQLEDIEREKSFMSSERAGEIIQYLQNNQLDPISSGNNYNQTDISNKMDEHV